MFKLPFVLRSKLTDQTLATIKALEEKVAIGKKLLTVCEENTKLRRQLENVKQNRDPKTGQFVKKEKTTSSAGYARSDEYSKRQYRDCC